MKGLRILRLMTACVVLLSPVVHAQEGFREVTRQTCQAHFITADHLGNLYTLEGTTLARRDTAGHVLFTYSDFNAGLFTSIDATDPLKLLLFSRDFSSLRLLDQKLSLQGSEIILPQEVRGNVSLACTSYESGYWLYDEANVELLRYNHQGELQQNSGNINLASGEEIHALFMLEHQQNVYVGDSTRGLYVFDRYGAFLKKLPFAGIHALQPMGDVLFLFSNSSVTAYNQLDKKQQTFQLPHAAVSSCMMRDRLFILSGQELIIYH